MEHNVIDQLSKYCQPCASPPNSDRIHGLFAAEGIDLKTHMHKYGNMIKELYSRLEGYWEKREDRYSALGWRKSRVQSKVKVQDVMYLRLRL